jgi:hypothetical protein
MQLSKQNRHLERGAPADLWRHTLSQIPSLFGRLVYLSDLRSGNTGKYEHHGLAMKFGDEESHLALLQSHNETFAAWLGCSLEQQKADLDLYLAAVTPDRAAVVDAWLRLGPYRNVVPAAARESERQLFAADFQALLEVLRTEYGLKSHDPEDT